MLKGLLYSQIGYDCGDPKRAIVRGPQGYVQQGAEFHICPVLSDRVSLTGSVGYWGEKWGSCWWMLDFSALESEGDYTLAVQTQDGELTAQIHIGQYILWEKTVYPMAITQFETRAQMARNGRGWQDCGSDWREVSSHAPAILGLCEVVNSGYKYLTPEENERIQRQIVVGCDYIALCQDSAERLGLPVGSIVHEIPNHMVLIPGETATAAVALAYAGRVLTDLFPEKAAEYVRRAGKAIDYLLHQAKPYGQEGMSLWNHGAPDDFEKPDTLMTRDLLMMIYACTNLWAAGQSRYKADALSLFEQVAARQVPKDEAEDGLWGHFYTFGKQYKITEKACIHHHVGHDTGGIFPNFICGIIDMTRRFYDDPEVSRWKQLCLDYAYGYLKPACERNPFALMPEGVFGDEGLLDFCGPWHGFNATYGFAAAVAIELEAMTGDTAFRQIAVGNLQWIAGLNAGMAGSMFDSSVFYKPDLPRDKVVPMSMIYGVGDASCGCWVDIPGSVMNGFSTNPQFTMTVPPTRANDGPTQFADEDWVPHAGGFLAGLAKLRARKVFAFRAEEKAE